MAQNDSDTVSSLEDLLQRLALYRDDSSRDWVFRGHAAKSWGLTPKAGRPPMAGIDDLVLFREWRRVVFHHAPYSLASDWDWLALAQHHGLATRLLDWTPSPLVAAYFVTQPAYDQNGHVDEDGAIYCFSHVPNDESPDSNYVDTEKESITKVPKVKTLLPKTVAPRIVNQFGRFTVHPGARELEEGDKSYDLHKIVIQKEYKLQLRRDLNFLGVNHGTIYPDLDGVSQHLNWFFETYTPGEDEGAPSA